jgi:L-fucose isomerase-like protein
MAYQFDGVAREMSLDAMAIRCWTELQNEARISPCVVNGILADQGIPVAREAESISRFSTVWTLQAISGGSDLRLQFFPERCTNGRFTHRVSFLV